jgi:hypothetical protein
MRGCIEKVLLTGMSKKKLNIDKRQRLLFGQPLSFIIKDGN